MAISTGARISPPVLEDAVPVALPCTFPGLAFEWYLHPERGVRDLLGEIVIEERVSVFLALPRPPADVQPMTSQSEPGLDRFVDVFLETGEGYGVLPGLALLPWSSTWAGLLAPYRGAAKRAALGGIFDYWSATSVLTPPLTNAKGDTP